MSEDRAQEALRHLQTAAIELVAAARATLDVVDDLVRDPSALHDLMATVQRAAQAAAGASGGVAGDTADTERRPSDAGTSSSSRVTRINVS